MLRAQRAQEAQNSAASSEETSDEEQDEGLDGEVESADGVKVDFFSSRVVTE